MERHDGGSFEIVIGGRRRLRHERDVDEIVLHRLFANAAALVMPSLYEGFSLPALEAMAHGLPVIVSDTAAMRELVADAAAIVDPLGVDAIARAMDRLLTDPEHAARLAFLGRERATKFTWRATAEKRVDVYRSLAAP